MIQNELLDNAHEQIGAIASCTIIAKCFFLANLLIRLAIVVEGAQSPEYEQTAAGCPGESIINSALFAATRIV